jgi:hypothetical protein
MTALSARREAFLKAGRPYVLLAGLLSFWLAIAGARTDFAQTNAPTAGARVHIATRSQADRSDITRFGERVQAALASTGNDKAYWDY